MGGARSYAVRILYQATGFFIVALNVCRSERVRRDDNNRMFLICF